MRSGIRRSRRRHNKGMIALLGGIVAVFVIILIAVGIKFAISGWSPAGGNDGKKEDEANKVLVTDIQVTCDRPVVRAGEPIQLNVSVAPENATDKTVKWTISGDMGCVDEKGVFTPAVEAGKSDVEVTATSNDGTEVFGSVTIRVLEAVDPSKPMVAITYDDGPHKTNTPKLLDVLEENYAVATFFMVGQNIEGKEDIIRRSYNLGNEVGNHTWDHENLSKVGEDTIKKQLADTDAAIKAVVNVENPILRPPFGAFNDKVKSVCGKSIIIWSVDTMDWSTRSADKTYEACMGAQDGDIILMHDIHEPTIVAAEDIVKGLQAKGFQLVTVTELYEYRMGDFGPGKANYKMTLDEYNRILAEQAAASTETQETAPTDSTGDGTEANSSGADTEAGNGSTENPDTPVSIG